MAFLHVLLPLYLESRGFGDATIGAVYGLLPLAAVAGRLLSGGAIDRHGPRPFIVLGGLAWALTSPLMGLTGNLAALVACRVAQGVGVGVFTNATLGALAGGAGRRQGRAVSWWLLSYGVAALAGPVLGDALRRGLGFEALFLVAGVLAAAAALLGLAMPGGRPAAGGKASRTLIGAALLPGSFGVAVGVVFGVFTAFGQLRAAALGVREVGLFLTGFTAAMLAGQFTAGRVCDRWSPHHAALPGLALLASGMVMLSLAAGPGALLAVPAVLGIGVGLARTALTAWSMRRGGPTAATAAGSTFTSLYELGVFAGPAALGALAAAGGAGRFLVAGMAAAVALAGYAACLVAARGRHDRAERRLEAARSRR